MMNEKESDFEYQVLDELPGGSLRVAYIPNDGPGIGRDGLMVKFIPNSGESWIGIFAFGNMLPEGDCQAYPGPGRNHLTILAKGNAYIASPNSSDSIIRVKSRPAIRAVPVPSKSLMLFHDYTEIVAYNKDGMAWETKRISWDGIEINEVSEAAILGTSWDAPDEKHVQFMVNLTDGSHQGGSSPPDADHPPS